MIRFRLLPRGGDQGCITVWSMCNSVKAKPWSRRPPEERASHSSRVQATLAGATGSLGGFSCPRLECTRLLERPLRGLETYLLILRAPKPQQTHQRCRGQ